MLRLLRDPLLHFMVLGAALFGLWGYFNPDHADNDPGIIKVDRAALLEFIQFRTHAFSEADAQSRLASLSAEALADIVNEYVREEALYRTAVAMGLDKDDYVIKQRMVQKMEYMAEGVPAEGAVPSDVELSDFYQLHREAYEEAAQISFTHVFFSGSRHGAVQAATLAAEASIDLNRKQVPFTGATGFGERFPYQVNYVERTREEVTSHFGADMADALFALEPDENKWRGVYTSSFGSHLVLLVKSTPARFPEFAEVRSRVLQDFLAERLRLQKAEFIARVVSKYRIETSQDLRTAAAP